MKNNLSDAKRLEMILNQLQITGNKLSKVLNYKSPASVYHVLEGINNLSSKMIEGIVGKFPQVNYHFLKNGKGEPILKNPADQLKQRDLFGALLENPEPVKVNYQKAGAKYDEAVQLEILIDNAKETNILLNALLKEIQHLNKKL